MRRVRQILLFPVIGAVVNVLVAMVCARWEQHFPGKWGNPLGVSWIPKDACECLSEPDGGLPSRPPSVLEYEVVTELSLVRTSKRYSRWHDERYGGFRYMHTSNGFGLPLRSMRYADQSYFCMAAYPEFLSGRVLGVRGGWPFANVDEENWTSASFGPPKHVYPLIPLPLGFAVNTAFYGLVAWSLAAGGAAFRRRQRAKRGLCVSCGYEVRGLSVCPECGVGKL